MVRKLPEDSNYIIFADNLFSSLQLVKLLKSRGFFYVGTVRENRLKGCSLKPEKVLRKEKRGATDEKVEMNSNVVAVRWYDNRKVDLISSFIGSHPMGKVKRYDKKAKETIEVDCPAVVEKYNKNMGGVDLLNSI
ncbi:PiggyBac transposable element-derived 4-like protein [Plakobranchus ocellatus]|uniref:PiggyBac transposable element-derived 4-like protein n=1 Tax=Plakobranchus ocellatus TaxID=259542 RepID=A0AAV3Y9B0_9GAST|nr:PiggyBac transposable element-derived 4-like protein [Plakobranchus ocellatus]